MWPAAPLAGLALAVLTAGAWSAPTGAPQKVVSMNLCTDQLAMMLSGPGQLHSVSYIASDPRASAMAQEATAFVTNHGLAEEIYLMRPDLVIAGAFSTSATVAMLRRLDIPVIVFEPAYSLTDVRSRILKMGKALHQEEAADALVQDYDLRLEKLRSDVSNTQSAPLEAVLYYANGYTSGDQSLAGQILTTAGFANAAAEHGYTSGTKMPLEVLAMTNPDAVITSQPYPGHSRSEDVLTHPVVQTLKETRAGSSITDHDWICGTPYVLRAIEELAAERTQIQDAEE